MIILQNGEQLIRKDDVELFSDEKKFGKGVLYLTNARLMFETENGTVPRLVALHTVQSVVPVKKHEFTVSYISDDSFRIFTDRYKMSDRRNCRDWIGDFQKIFNASISSDRESTLSSLTTEDAGSKRDSHTDSQNELLVDVNSITLSWKRRDSWRKFPEEHVWQGRNRLNSMNKKEWLAYKHESNKLEEMLMTLYNNYCESKNNRNMNQCREIRKIMKIIDKELFGKGEIPYKDVEADEIADTRPFSS